MRDAIREIAWDGRGKWAGDGPAPSYPRPPLDVKHQCGSRAQPERRDPRCGIFTCAWCKRVVPWCYGAGGENELEDHICDGCWDERDKASRPTRPFLCCPECDAPAATADKFNTAADAEALSEPEGWVFENCSWGPCPSCGVVLSVECDDKRSWLVADTEPAEALNG
jgi:hypothetical protein